MIPAATFALLGPGGAAVLAATVAVAAIAAGLYWRRSGAREPWLMTVLVSLRVAVLLALGIAIADPAITREVTRLPRLRVVWDDAARLDVADAPGGVTRRDELERALAEARDAGLEERFEVVEEGEQAPDATLLLTDAAANETTTSRLEGRVLALVPRTDTSLPDLAILAVAAPPRGTPGAPRTLTATIRCIGAAGRKAIVSVSDGSRVLASGAVDVAHVDEVLSVELSFVSQAEGWQRLDVDVAGMTGEVELGNNRRSVWIASESRARRVLFVESQPTWEGKFVRRALEEDPAFSVDYVARTSKAAGIAQAPEGAATQPASPSVRAAFGDSARLFDYDAIVLGPLDAAELAEGDLARLAAFVDRRGGGLVVLGGNAYGGSILSSRGVLADLLPAAVPASSLGAAERNREQRKGAALIRPAEGRERHPVFAALGEHPGAALERLQRLGTDYLRLGPLKPGAVALAEDSAAPGGGKPVLLAVHPYGAGRVALVAPQDTWKLAVGAPPEMTGAAARVWTSLVAWCSANAHDPVALDAREGSVATSSTTRVDLLVRSKTYEPAASVDVRAWAALEGGADRVPVAFAPDTESPGVYTADVVLPRAGTWQIEAEVNGRERASVGLVAVDSDLDAERSRRDPIRFERFREAVAASGGGVFDADSTAEMVAASSDAGARVVVETSRPARTILWGLAIVLVAIAEMFLRRWYAIE